MNYESEIESTLNFWKKHNKESESVKADAGSSCSTQAVLSAAGTSLLSYRQSPDLWNNNNKRFPNKTSVVWNHKKQKWMF